MPTNCISPLKSIRKKLFRDAALARKWRRYPVAAGALGEALARRWLRVDRGIEFDNIDQSPTTKLETCPPDGKRPDFLLILDPDTDEIVFADAKLHSTDNLKQFCLSNVELEKYRNFLKYHESKHLVFLLIPNETRDCLITVHIDQLVETCEGNCSCVSLGEITEGYKYPLPDDWEHQEIGQLIEQNEFGFELQDFSRPK